MTEKRKKLVLLDAHAIIHRAYHGMPDFATRAGVPTGAIYGFSTMVLRIIDDFNPDYIVACYDLPGPTFRHESYSDYKGTRSKTDEALKMQFGPTREACDIFSIPIYDAVGFEADDVLGTICEQLKDEPIDIIIASGDMDTLQLVDKKRVQVFTLKRGNDTVIYDEAAVIERFKFDPISIIDYKALRGDASDNIPGIRGIGDKAATLAISEFGTIEKMYVALEQDEQKLLDIGMTKRMVGLIRDGQENAEFSKILATIRLDVPMEFKIPETDWHSAVDVEAALTFFEKYEFRGLASRLHRTFGTTAPEREIEPEIIEEINNDELQQTAIALCLLDSDLTDAGIEKISEYTGNKSFKESSEQIFTELKTLEKSNLLYEEIEKPLFPIVQVMQKNGVLIDTDFFTKLGKKYHTESSKIEKKIFELSGEEFNVKSPKQLSEVLFVKMKLPTKGVKKSKTGTYSTNIKTLELLRDEHDIIQYVVEYRELQKLLSTYIDIIPIMVGDDGRLHAEFLQNGTATGRFSSRNPNLQNIPTRTELGRKIREGFVAAPGQVLVSFDYSQIELRILAFLSGDKNLIQIFKDGRDIHTAVASQIANVDEKDVDRVMRNKAKAVNFGILYGMGINSLKKAMNSDREEAQMFYNGFFENYPKAAAFLEVTKQSARDQGYTETLFGRRRQFRNINSKLGFIRAMAERMALNAPIQGTSADIIKLAMIHVDNYIRKSKLSAKLILQIHDEMVYEINETEVGDFSKNVVKIMEGVLENSYLKYESEVPLIVHSSIGKHWGELK
ncbi:MAG: DNA polymerase [Candidatus Pacebacteria bacterium]|nr:DNA polymerase [Candidatus Paceibacterota bacterium]